MLFIAFIGVSKKFLISFKFLKIALKTFLSHENEFDEELKKTIANISRKEILSIEDEFGKRQYSTD